MSLDFSPQFFPHRDFYIFKDNIAILVLHQNIFTAFFTVKSLKNAEDVWDLNQTEYNGNRFMWKSGQRSKLGLYASFMSFRIESWYKERKC